MNDILAILRRRDIRVVVLAVVLGEAIAHGARALIVVVTNAVPLAFATRGSMQNAAWTEFVARTLTHTVITIGLWAAVAVVTLALLRRLLGGSFEESPST